MHRGFFVSLKEDDMNVYAREMVDGSICPEAGDEKPCLAAGSNGGAGLDDIRGSRQTLHSKRRGWDWKQMNVLRHVRERKLPL